MSDIEIDYMTEEDLDEVLNISRLSFPIAWSRESFEKELTNTFAKYLVIKKNGVVVGYGGMWIIIDEAHITNIAIHPEYRGISLGSLVLTEMLKLCNEYKVTGITLEVRISNNVAKNLYEKFGFLEEGLRKHYYEDNGEDALIMWKRIF